MGSIKVRARGYSTGRLLAGLAAAQLAGADHLVGLDRHRADAAGQALTPVAEAVLDPCGGAGPSDQRGAVGTGRDGARGGECRDAGPAIRRASRGALPDGDDRSGCARRCWLCRGGVGHCRVPAGCGLRDGAKRIAPLRRILAGILDTDWAEVIDMSGAQLAVATTAPPGGRRRPGC